MVSYFSQGSKVLTMTLHKPSPDPHYLWHLCHALLCSCSYIHTGFLAVPSETNTLLCILALAPPGMFFPRYLHGPLPHPTQSLLKYIVSSRRAHLTTYSVSPSSPHSDLPCPAQLFNSICCLLLHHIIYLFIYYIYYFFSQIECKFHGGKYFHQFWFLMYHRAQRRLLIKIFD